MGLGDVVQSCHLGAVCGISPPLSSLMMLSYDMKLPLGKESWSHHCMHYLRTRKREEAFWRPMKLLIKRAKELGKVRNERAVMLRSKK